MDPKSIKKRPISDVVVRTNNVAPKCQNDSKIDQKNVRSPTSSFARTTSLQRSGSGCRRCDADRNVRQNISFTEVKPRFIENRRVRPEREFNKTNAEQRCQNLYKNTLFFDKKRFVPKDRRTKNKSKNDANICQKIHVFR